MRFIYTLQMVLIALKLLKITWSWSLVLIPMIVNVIFILTRIFMDFNCEDETEE